MSCLVRPTHWTRVHFTGILLFIWGPTDCLTIRGNDWIMSKVYLTFNWNKCNIVVVVHPGAQVVLRWQSDVSQVSNAFGPIYSRSSNFFTISSCYWKTWLEALLRAPEGLNAVPLQGCGDRGGCYQGRRGCTGLHETGLPLPNALPTPPILPRTSAAIASIALFNCLVFNPHRGQSFQWLWEVNLLLFGLHLDGYLL